MKSKKLINKTMILEKGENQSAYSPNINNKSKPNYWTNSEDHRNTNFMSQDINRVSDNKQTTASVFSSQEEAAKTISTQQTQD
jgi:hypothetical protein